MSELFPIWVLFLTAPLAGVISYTLILFRNTRTSSGSRHRTRYERLQLEALYGEVGYRARPGA